MIWRDKTVLITGGTGYIGRHLVKHLKGKAYKTMVYARDPHKHETMAREHPEVRNLIGDVRDEDRLNLACEGADIVIHAAAMKSVPLCEYNSMDAMSINVRGTHNVLMAAHYSNSKVVFISTDKAVEAINTYGKTKALAEDMSRSYYHYLVDSRAVRYGNVMGSTGSVLEYWESLVRESEIPVTDPECTRFWVEPYEAIELIETALGEEQGSLVVGRFPSVKIGDLAAVVNERSRYFSANRTFKIVGLRPGEKMHETLVSKNEGEEYTSDTNDWWLSEEEIRERVDSLHQARPGDERRPTGRRESPIVIPPNPWPPDNRV